MNGDRISFSWLLPFVEHGLGWAINMQLDYEDSPIMKHQHPFIKSLFKIESGYL